MPATRDPWLDNAKMTLVTLVVVGHSWILLPSFGLGDQLYDFLYLWHMPAFVFVTGYLSRSFDWSSKRLWQLVRTIAVPYVLFETALALFRIHVGGEELDNLFLDPHWPLWYLSAVFFWRLVTPIFRPMPGGVAVAVAISLIAGVWFGDTLDLARIAGLLPFFVLGLKATPERLERLRSPRVAIGSAAVLVALLVLARFTDSWAATEWFYYRARYDELTTSDLEAVLIRSAVLALGLAGTLAFLALVPRIGGWFTRMGAATLVVYLFHGFVVRGAQYAGARDITEQAPLLSLLVLSLLGVALALLLAWAPVASRLTELVDPFGYAERHTKAAIDLTIQVAEQEGRLEGQQDLASHGAVESERPEPEPLGGTRG